MLNPLKKHPVLIFIAVLIMLLLVWGFWPQPISVEAFTVERAPLAVTIEEEGKTRVIDRYVISAPVSGVACRQNLKVGDAVEQGQLLLSITPLESQVLDARSRAQAEARVSAATSALRAAEEQANAASAAAELADNELKRLRPLMESAMISRDEFDKASTLALTAAAARRSAEFNVETASYELEAARSLLDYPSAMGQASLERIAVRSPITGRVLRVARECEGPVNTGEPLLEVGDPAALEIEVDVLSADAVKIKPGVQVEFDRWGGDELLSGLVRTVEPVGFTRTSALGVDEQRVRIISDFTSPAELWRRLGDGYRVEARFILWQRNDVLQLPSSSLFRFNNGWAVFVLENGRAVRREVEVGQRNGLRAQIVQGVNEGEWVINHPAENVDDRVRVMVRIIE